MGRNMQSPGSGNRNQGMPAAARPSAPTHPQRQMPPAAANGAGPTDHPLVRPTRTDQSINAFARIKVIGVGGAGGNAVNRMVDASVQGIEFVAVNTDAQALQMNQAPIAVRIG